MLFQATFLVLARKAAAIGKREALAAWLHKVAFRVALRARNKTAERQSREHTAPRRLAEDPLAAITGRELLTVLDEELQALPEQHRAPLILCYLEEHTRDEAARLLGLSLRTLQRRLEKGRATLRYRLERRGLALPAAFLAAGTLQGAANAAVPGILVGTTVKAAMQTAAGEGLTGLVSAQAAHLVSGTLKAMAVGKAMTLGTVVIVLALVGTGIGFVTYRGLAARGDRQGPRVSGSAQATAPSESPAPVLARAKTETILPSPAESHKSEKEVMIAGQVIAADGKPVANARVGVLITLKYSGRDGDLTQRVEVIGPVKTANDGRFRLPARRFDWKSYLSVQLVATCQEHGLGWKDLSAEAKLAELVVALPKEQVFQGRLVDLQGQPAADVPVHLEFVGISRMDNPEGVRMWERHADLSMWPAPVTTDKEGRFAFRGLGLDSLLGFQVFDDRFARQEFFGQINKAEAKEITWTLAPARIIEGQVTAADTGKPIAYAGLMVLAGERQFGNWMGVSGRADEQGRFRVNPYPGAYFRITAYPPDGHPYLKSDTALTWPKGAIKQQVNVAVPPGALVRGKVTEAVSGEPVAGANVHFIPRTKDNPNLREGIESGTGITDAGGVFQITVVPGPGHLVFLGPTNDFIQIEMQSSKIYYDKPGGALSYAHAWEPIQAKAGAQQNVAVSVRRGVTVQGRLVNAEGKPVAEALMAGQLITETSTALRHEFDRRPFSIPARAGQFELHGLDPKETYTVYFLDPKNKQGAVAKISGKDAGGEPVTVRLEHCGSAVVRFVDATGKPVVGLGNFPFEIVIQPGASAFDRAALDKGLVFESTQFVANLDRLNHWHPPPTDAQGQATLRALIPGAKYLIRNSSTGSKMRASEYFEVEAGKTVKLPDVQWSE